MKMTSSGKFNGVELDQIPIWYLDWFLRERSESATPALILAIRDQLESAKPPLTVVADEVEEPFTEEDEPILEDIPHEEAATNKTLLLLELERIKADLQRVETDRANLQDSISKFTDYFDKWYRVMYPILQLDRNHIAEVYFNQLKKEVEKWKRG